MPEYVREGQKSCSIGNRVVSEVQDGVAHAQLRIEDARAGTTVVRDDVGDDHDVLDDVPPLEPDPEEENASMAKRGTTDLASGDRNNPHAMTTRLAR